MRVQDDARLGGDGSGRGRRAGQDSGPRLPFRRVPAALRVLSRRTAAPAGCGGGPVRRRRPPGAPPRAARKDAPARPRCASAKSRKKMSSASAMRPAAASSAPTAESCCRTEARPSTMWYFGSSRSPANSLVRFSAPRTRRARSLPAGPPRLPATAGEPLDPGLRLAGGIGELPVRRQRGIVEFEVVREDAEDVPGVVGPAGHAEVDFRDGAVPVPCRGNPPARTARRRAARRRGTAAASSGGEDSSKTAAAPAWARMSVASCQRARSISVVTLLGSPRNTGCRAPELRALA